jgi:hypothetical protein
LVPPTRQHFVAGLWQTSHFGRFRCACSHDVPAWAEVRPNRWRHTVDTRV